MRKTIYDVDYENRIFYTIINNNKIGHYFTRSKANIYMPMIEKGFVIDFISGEKRKHFYEVVSIDSIYNPKQRKYIFNLDYLKKDMYEVLSNTNNLLFIDFEMTMPKYGHYGFFQSEIIEVGYILKNKNNDTIFENNYYIKPKLNKMISNRTIKFLKLDLNHFNKYSYDYNYFYHDLSNIIKKYNPKVITWSTGDKKRLNDSYKIHKVDKIIKDHNFIDLLKLHKDYFSLQNDLGLFKAYKDYYDIDEVQAHSAYEDAKILSEVYDGFMNYIEKDIKKINE